MKGLLVLFAVLLPLKAYAFGLASDCATTGNSLQWSAAGGFSCPTAPQRPTTTVSGLPTCNSGAKGLMYFVTDALAPVAIAAVSSGGAVQVGVTCNGTSWIVQ